ncbi:uncharacterized protein LOC124934708 [Impatiens glandulifera]|uniref:uncharacterized protein LOC124934708 n=1 Tax=Impatiens glandulifera TaxID=253017 RepID=UPI001FB1135E|nr:uncharacterized protein LOC124934708 [Impatiens glandulifera]
MVYKKRIQHYPKTYAQNFAIGDCMLSNKFQLQHKTFVEDRDAGKLDEEGKLQDFIEYVWDQPNNYLQPWMEVDHIYMPMNILEYHWVLCVARLQEWRIDVYVCQQGIYSEEQMESFTAPMREMLPYVLHKTLYPPQLLRFPWFTLDPMDFRRIPHPEVPKCGKSRDCGVFVMSYIEWLTTNLDIREVTLDIMIRLRKKWAVRLFHQIIDL